MSHNDMLMHAQRKGGSTAPPIPNPGARSEYVLNTTFRPLYPLK